MKRKLKVEKPKIKTFYGVLKFGKKDLNSVRRVDWNGWIEIRAFNYAGAKEKMNTFFKSKWDRIYTDQQFTGSVMKHYPEGCQTNI